MVDKLVLSAIHARFRQLRNGEVVDNLAAQGITYRLAWGLESYRLREIAQEFAPSAELADALWNEEVRESKMLATRLYPISEMTEEKALGWIAEIKYTELADQICMNMLAKLPFAQQLADDLLNADFCTDPIKTYTALKIATRIEWLSDRCLAVAESLINSEAPLYLKTAALWYKQMYEQEKRRNCKEARSDRQEDLSCQQRGNRS